MRRRRPRLLVLVAALVGLAVSAALTYRVFVRPATDRPARVDAVVVFAGGGGERQQAGIRLVADGLAPVLVLSDGGRPGSRRTRACREPSGLRVLCLTPRPADTGGEARAFGDLAARERWDTLLLVTSTYHVRRASLLFGQCHRGRLFTAATEPDNDHRWELAVQVLRELVAVPVAATVGRPC
jgi:uncharacterized SAM-binding protein YcdF (DUF218 family)